MSAARNPGRSPAGHMGRWREAVKMKTPEENCIQLRRAKGLYRRDSSQRVGRVTGSGEGRLKHQVIGNRGKPLPLERQEEAGGGPSVTEAP